MIRVLAFLAALTGASAAQAAECVPLTKYDQMMVDNNIPSSALVTAKGAEFVLSYNAALGFKLPDDTNPVGMFFIVGPQSVLVAIVEAEGCVKYSAVIPLWKHQQALNGA